MRAANDGKGGEGGHGWQANSGVQHVTFQTVTVILASNGSRALLHQGHGE